MIIIIITNNHTLIYAHVQIKSLIQTIYSYYISKNYNMKKIKHQKMLSFIHILYTVFTSITQSIVCHCILTTFNPSYSLFVYIFHLIYVVTHRIYTLKNNIQRTSKHSFSKYFCFNLYNSRYLG